eukprot:723804-Karenia_brevis.AAC.1
MSPIAKASRPKVLPNVIGVHTPFWDCVPANYGLGGGGGSTWLNGMGALGGGGTHLSLSTV